MCALHALLDTLHSPVARDVAWSVFSADLLDLDRVERPRPICDGRRFALNDARIALLHDLDRSPEALTLHTAGKLPLGIRFERLWAWFVENDASLTLLGRNLPVRERGRTTGEVDLLVFCHDTEQTLHVELAVKFYLQVPGESGARLSHWWGPNPEDRLSRKTHHLLHHQLRPEAAKLVHNGESAVPVCVMKGRLFGRASGTQPDALHADQHLFRAEADVHNLPADQPLALLDKRHWLAPVVAWKNPVARATIAQHIDASGGRPQLVALLDESGGELDRWFVHDGRWPRVNTDRRRGQRAAEKRPPTPD